MTPMTRFQYLTVYRALVGTAVGEVSVSMDPVGYVSISVPAESDAVLSVPMIPISAFGGVIPSIARNKLTLNAVPTLPVGLAGTAHGDQILGFNKSASQFFIMDGGLWIDKITGLPAANGFQFIPGFGYTCRKAATSNPAVTFWIGLLSYLP
jgi:hypothetical protein